MSANRRFEKAATIETQVLALLTERYGERLTAAEIAQALGKEPEGVRSAINRLWAKQAVVRCRQRHDYPVGNAVAKHVRYLWFVPTEKPQEARSLSGDING